MSWPRRQWWNAQLWLASRSPLAAMRLLVIVAAFILVAGITGDPNFFLVALFGMICLSFGILLRELARARRIKPGIGAELVAWGAPPLCGHPVVTEDGQAVELLWHGPARGFSLRIERQASQLKFSLVMSPETTAEVGEIMGRQEALMATPCGMLTDEGLIPGASNVIEVPASLGAFVYVGPHIQHQLLHYLEWAGAQPRTD